MKNGVMLDTEYVGLSLADFQVELQKYAGGAALPLPVHTSL